MSYEPQWRTPPEVKWVVNELAAVQGELDRIEESLGRLLERKAHLLSVKEALGTVAVELHLPTTPGLLPVVRPNDRFGARGSLRKFIRVVLQAAHPKGVSTSSIADMVIDAFQLQIANPLERKRLVDNTVRNALTRMGRQGEVEPMHSQQEDGSRMGLIAQSGVWRWKQRTTTLDELRACVSQCLGPED